MTGKSEGQLELVAGGAEPARGPGRPKGARNRRGRDWQAYAATMGVHPIEFLLKTVAKTEADLARELGLFAIEPESGTILRDKDGEPLLARGALLEAHKARRDAAREVLPYVEQKLPAMDDEDGKTDKRIVMIVGTMSAEQTAKVASAGLGFRLKENQQVIDAEPVQSDAQQSETVKDQGHDSE